MLRIMQEKIRHDTKPTNFATFSWISATECLHSPPTHHHALSKKTNLVLPKWYIILSPLQKVMNTAT